MDWTDIGIIITSVLLLLAGGYIRKLTQEIKELIDAIIRALLDNHITKDELATILAEAKDVKNVALSIAKVITRAK